MKLALKAFGPYGLKPRVGEAIEREVKDWAKDKDLSIENVKPITTTLPDRTAILLIFYNEEPQTY